MKEVFNKKNISNNKHHAFGNYNTIDNGNSTNIDHAIGMHKNNNEDYLVANQNNSIAMNGCNVLPPPSVTASRSAAGANVSAHLPLNSEPLDLRQRLSTDAAAALASSYHQSHQLSTSYQQLNQKLMATLSQQSTNNSNSFSPISAAGCSVSASSDSVNYSTFRSTINQSSSARLSVSPLSKESSCIALLPINQRLEHEQKVREHTVFANNLVKNQDRYSRIEKKFDNNDRGIVNPLHQQHIKCKTSTKKNEKKSTDSRAKSARKTLKASSRSPSKKKKAQTHRLENQQLQLVQPRVGQKRPETIGQVKQLEQQKEMQQETQQSRIKKAASTAMMLSETKASHINANKNRDAIVDDKTRISSSQSKSFLDFKANPSVVHKKTNISAIPPIKNGCSSDVEKNRKKAKKPACSNIEAITSTDVKDTCEMADPISSQKKRKKEDELQKDQIMKQTRTKKTKRKFPTIRIKDEYPDRLVNPLLELPRIVGNGQHSSSSLSIASPSRKHDPIQAAELWNWMEVVFPKPDTFPISYYARLLGWTIPSVHTSGPVSARENFVSNSSSSYVIPTSKIYDDWNINESSIGIKTPKELLELEQKNAFDNIQNIPLLGKWFSNCYYRKCVRANQVATDSSKSWCKHNFMLDHIDPVYQSLYLLKHNKKWNKQLAPLVIAEQRGKSSTVIQNENEGEIPDSFSPFLTVPPNRLQKLLQQAESSLIDPVIAMALKHKIICGNDWSFEYFPKFDNKDNHISSLSLQASEKIRDASGNNAINAKSSKMLSSFWNDLKLNQRCDQANTCGVISSFRNKPIEFLRYHFFYYRLPEDILPKISKGARVSELVVLIRHDNIASSNKSKDNDNNNNISSQNKLFTTKVERCIKKTSPAVRFSHERETNGTKENKKEDQVGGAEYDDNKAKISENVLLLMYSLIIEHARACDVYYCLVEAPGKIVPFLQQFFRMTLLSEDKEENKRDKETHAMEDILDINYDCANERDCVHLLLCDLKQCTYKYAFLSWKERMRPFKNQHEIILHHEMEGYNKVEKTPSLKLQLPANISTAACKTDAFATSATIAARERYWARLPNEEETELALLKQKLPDMVDAIHEMTMIASTNTIRPKRNITRNGTRNSKYENSFCGAVGSTRDAVVGLRVVLRDAQETESDTGMEMYRIDSNGNEVGKITMAIFHQDLAIDIIKGFSLNAIASIIATQKNEECQHLTARQVPNDDSINCDDLLHELMKKQEELRSIENGIQRSSRLLLKQVVNERVNYEKCVYKRVNEEQAFLANEKILDRRKEMDLAWQEQLEQDMDAVCDICNDGEVLPDNQILFCEACNVAVHQNCYGIEKVPEGDYYCKACTYFGREKMTQTIERQTTRNASINESSSCTMSSPKLMVSPLPISCELCPRKQGAFIRTDISRHRIKKTGNSGGKNRINSTNSDCVDVISSKWVHVVCAKWQGLNFVDNNNLNLIEDVTQLKKEFKQLACKCCLCLSECGTFNKCRVDGCDKWMHVTCARASGLCDVVHGENAQGPFQLNAWILMCPLHSVDTTTSINNKDVGENENEDDKLVSSRNINDNDKRVPIEQLNRIAQESPPDPKPKPNPQLSKQFNKMTGKERRKLLTNPKKEAKIIYEISTKLFGVRCEVCDAREDEGLSLIKCISCGVVFCDSCHLKGDNVDKTKRNDYECAACRWIAENETAKQHREYQPEKETVTFERLEGNMMNGNGLKRKEMNIICSTNKLSRSPSSPSTLTSEGFEKPKCYICYQGGGWLRKGYADPMKPTAWSKRPQDYKKSLFGKIIWCHSLCALWNSGCIVLDANTGRVNLSNVVLGNGKEFIKKKVACFLCGNKGGLKMKCNKESKCGPVSFHVTCARQAGLEVRDEYKNAMFYLKCYQHGGAEYNLRARLEDLIEFEKTRGGKRLENTNIPMLCDHSSKLLNAAILVMKILGWAWRWAEWWVDHGSNWEPFLEEHECEEDMTKEQLKIVNSTKESRCKDARQCRLAAFGAALRNRNYDLDFNGNLFDNLSFERALRSILYTKSLVGPMEENEIVFFVEWLGRAYRSKSRLLGFGDHKIPVCKEGTGIHLEDESPKFILGSRTLPGKQELVDGQVFENTKEVDDFLKVCSLETHVTKAMNSYGKGKKSLETSDISKIGRLRNCEKEECLTQKIATRNGERKKGLREEANISSLVDTARATRDVDSLTSGESPECGDYKPVGRFNNTHLSMKLKSPESSKNVVIFEESVSNNASKPMKRNRRNEQRRHGDSSGLDNRAALKSCPLENKKSSCVLSDATAIMQSSGISIRKRGVVKTKSPIKCLAASDLVLATENSFDKKQIASFDPDAKAIGVKSTESRLFPTISKKRRTKHQCFSEPPSQDNEKPGFVAREPCSSITKGNRRGLRKRKIITRSTDRYASANSDQKCSSHKIGNTVKRLHNEVDRPGGETMRNEGRDIVPKKRKNLISATVSTKENRSMRAFVKQKNSFPGTASSSATDNTTKYYGKHHR